MSKNLLIRRHTEKSKMKCYGLNGAIEGIVFAKNKKEATKKLLRAFKDITQYWVHLNIKQG